MSDLLYGRNAVREALRAGRKIMRLYVAEPGSSPPAAARPAARRGGRPEPARAVAGRAGSGRPGTTRAGSGGRPGAPPPRALPGQETRSEPRVAGQAGRAPLDPNAPLARSIGVPVGLVP